MRSKINAQACTTWLRTILALPKVNPDYDILCCAFQALYNDKADTAIKVINAEFDTRYQARRFMEWRRKETGVPRKILDFMRSQVIVSRFDLETADQLCRLLDLKGPHDDLV